MNMTLTKRRPWVYLTVMAATVPVPLLAAWMGRAAGQGPEFAWGVAALWMAVWVGLGALYIRRLDETARAAQRWAWEWGGALGLGAAVLAALFGWYLFPGLAEAFGRFVAERSDHPAATGFAYGASFASLVAIFGWLIAFVIWWAPKQGGGK